MNIDIFIDKLNTLIESAVENGGDCGGSYNQCLNKLKKSIQDILQFLQIEDLYDIVDTNNLGCYSPYKVVKKCVANDNRK